MLRLRAFFLLFSVSVALTGCQQDSSPSDPLPQAPSTEAGASAPLVNETPEQRAARLQATFPAQQRPPEDPQQVAKGLDIYSINCRSCHGQDLRGGDLGGPNLLRSDIVLKDESGDLIGKVVQEGRNPTGQTAMPALALAQADITAVAAYIHSVVATARGQGAPPPGTEVPLNIVVGDAEAGARYFAAQCSSCHSVTGDLAGIASKVDDAEALQNSWVAGRRWGAPQEADNPARQVMVTVSLSNGGTISGQLRRLDDFLVSLTTRDNQYRSFTRHENTTPSVTDIRIEDPLARHLELLSELSDDDMHNVTAYLVNLK